MTEVIGGLFAPLVIMLVMIMVFERLVRGVIDTLKELWSLIQ